VEEQRGYEFRGLLWIPGRFEITMHLGQCVTMIASVEDEDVTFDQKLHTIKLGVNYRF